MSLTDFLFGKKEKMEQLPTLSPEQQSLLNQLLGGLGVPAGQGLEYLSSILSGDPEAFEAYEAPIKRQFEEETVPGLAERFSEMGGGAQRSSAFAQTLGKAGESLSEKLAAQRANLRQGAMSQLQSLLGLGIKTPTFGYQQTGGTPGFLQSLAPAIGVGLGGAFSPTISGLGGGLARLFGGGSFGKGYRGAI